MDTLYVDGQIVWVKLSNCWWPGEVYEDHRLPEDMQKDMKKTFKKRPYAVVKFFQEDAYEFVKNLNNIHIYQSDRRLDFIRRGIEMYQANHKYMAMFPADVATAERRTNGDPDIINDPEVLNPAKPTPRKWADIFSAKKPKRASASNATPSRPAVPPIVALPKRVMHKEHEVRILSPSTQSSASSMAGLGPTEGQTLYECHECSFRTTRLNVFILHDKSHTSGALQPPQPPPPPAAVARASATKTPNVIAKSRVNEEKEKKVTAVKRSGSKPGRPLTKLRKRAATPEQVDSSDAMSSEDEKEAEIEEVIVKVAPKPKQAKSRPPKKRTRGRAMTKSPEIVDTKVEEKEEEEETRAPTPMEVEDVQIPSKSKQELKNELLKDWSEDEDGHEQTASTKAEKSPADVIPAIAKEKRPSNDVVTGRSSPLRCRNIPKKERRDFNYESIVSEPPVVKEPPAVVMDLVTTEPMAIEPATTEPMNSKPMADEPMEVESVKVVDLPPIVVEVQPPPPIVVVQKKKKAVERLQQKESIENKSCFDFDDSEEPTPVIRTPDASVDSKPAVRVTRDDNNDDTEQKDAELLSQIDVLLQSTTDHKTPIKVAPLNHDKAADDNNEKEVSKEVVLTATSDQPRVISLPPKERGKRIFKSRNRNDAEPKEEIVAAAVVVVAAAAPANGEHTEVVSKQQQPQTNNRTPEQQRIVQVPRKRKYDQSLIAKREPVSVVVATEVDSLPAAAAPGGDSSDMQAALLTPNAPPECSPPKIALPDMGNDNDEEAAAAVVVVVGSKQAVTVSKAAKDVKEAKDVVMAAAKGSVLRQSGPKVQRSKRNSAGGGVLVEARETSNGDADREQMVEAPATEAPATEAVEPVEVNGESSRVQESPVKTVSTQEEEEEEEETIEETIVVISTDNATEAAAEMPTISGSDSSSSSSNSNSSNNNNSSSSNNNNNNISNSSPTMEAELTATATAAVVVNEPIQDKQLLAIPSETFGGPANSFFLCTVDDGNFIPIDNQPLYLDPSNQLVPMPMPESMMNAALVAAATSSGAPISLATVLEQPRDGDVASRVVIGPEDQLIDLSDTDQKYILEIHGQQILLDHQSLLTIASGDEPPRLVLPDGQEMIIEGTPQEILASITVVQTSGADYEGSAVGYEGDIVSHDMIATALAKAESTVFAQDLGATRPNLVSAAHVSETNAVLTQPPIMSTLEVPSKTAPLRAGGVAADGAGSGGGGSVLVGAAAGAALDSDSLAAVIGVTAASKTNQNIPASLALPITITDPTIAAKTTQASIKSVYLTTTSAALSDGTEIWDPMHATTTTTTSNTADNEEEEEDEITTITIEEEDQNGEL